MIPGGIFMLEIVIVEDNEELLNLYQVILQNELEKSESSDKILLSTSNPRELKNLIVKQPEHPRMYLLDIAFSNSQVKGVDLAREIRKIDNVGKIVFISSHSELLQTTIASQVEVFDYIDKLNGISEINNRIIDDYHKISNCFISTPRKKGAKFSYKFGNQHFKISIPSIDFFEMSNNPHKIIMQTADSLSEISCTLLEISNEIPSFYRLSRRLLVNLKNINNIDLVHEKIIFKDGNSLKASYSKCIQVSLLNRFR